MVRVERISWNGRFLSEDIMSRAEAFNKFKAWLHVDETEFNVAIDTDVVGLVIDNALWRHSTIMYKFTAVKWSNKVNRYVTDRAW